MDRMEEIVKYSRVYDISQLVAVQSWLMKFKWNDDDLERITLLIEDYHKEKMLLAEALSKAPRKRKKPTKDMEQIRRDAEKSVEELKKYHIPPLPTVDLCPECGSTMGGQPTRACKKARLGRIFYKECNACTYYEELWMKGNKTFKTTSKEVNTLK